MQSTAAHGQTCGQVSLSFVGQYVLFCEVGAVCLYRGAARVFLRVMCIYMSSSCNGVMILSNKENYSERMPLSAKQLCRVRTRCDLEIVNE